MTPSACRLIIAVYSSLYPTSSIKEFTLQISSKSFQRYSLESMTDIQRVTDTHIMSNFDCLTKYKTDTNKICFLIFKTKTVKTYVAHIIALSLWYKNDIIFTAVSERI